MGTTHSGIRRHGTAVIGAEMREALGIFRAVALGTLMWTSLVLAYLHL